jgi:glutaryl-CoA dehydrogenase
LVLFGAIGAAMDCYDTALRYAKKEFSLTSLLQEHSYNKKKLAEMITEITKAQRLQNSVLRNEGKATAQIFMAKRNM